MHVGILTAPLRTKPLAELIPWAAQQGIRALEIDVRAGSHLDALKVDDTALEQLQGLLSAHKVEISSLACYALLTGVSNEQVAQSRQAIEAAIKLAARLGVSTVCTLAGFPAAGKSKVKTIAEDLPSAMRPLLDLAGQNGVRLALENWYATNIQHLDHWRGVFEALPDAHFGLNFDPSHLDWQGIDVNAAVNEFRERIFHVHAKDVSVDLAKLKRVGYNGEGWWRYTLPGYGRILWGDFITTLRRIGYDGVLSIEHEDDAFPAEEGFVKSARYLNTLV
ncbi:MAG TPA: sugar phosphate isomerase/epimerase family protein [Roseiflexaceae bacterium]|nr:sugar phosphate isomerase/epimerase family protein [Roseiflexaceae bacterium]